MNVYNKRIIIIVIIVVIAVASGLMLRLFTEREAIVPIMYNFGTKLVYTVDVTEDPKPYLNHCRSLGGVFNECGTTCSPQADVCIQVCAYTCELFGK